MLAALLASALIAADVPAPSPRNGPSAGEMAAFREAEAKAGRSADAHVKLALWCEAHGLSTERVEHLALALAADPSHAAARGLLGFVREGGRWRRPEDIAGRAASDAKSAESLADYERRRELTPATAEAQWKLAQWCDKQGLKPQAEAHARATVRLDPSRKGAWERLGYRNRNGRWLTEEDAAAEKREAEAQEKATRAWVPRLQRLRADLRDPAKKAAAENELAAITDPRALPAVVRVFCTKDAADQARFVQILGQVPGRPGSRLLAVAALRADSAEVRRTAAETLARRDPREFMADLIGELRDLVKYQVQPVGGPGSPGVLLVEGKRFNVRRRYQVPDLPAATREYIRQRETGDFRGNDINRAVTRQTVPDALARRDATILQNLSEAQRVAESSQKALEADVAAIEAENAAARKLNERVLTILTATTGGDLGPDRESWMSWWSDRQGYAFVVPPSPGAKPTFDQLVPLAEPPTFASYVSNSCFAAGTLVTTRDGRRPIEGLKVGDMVLTQDVAAGTLAYEPVVAVFHNPPAPTLEVKLDDDAVVATGIHRFWVAGKGWTMARELKPGDLIRTVGGSSRVKSIEPKATQKVFNLEVARGRSFFVGEFGALVHDNTLVETPERAFDRAE